MPAHSSHILHPPIKPISLAYRRQSEGLMRYHITHTTKVEFLHSFYAAFQVTMTEIILKLSLKTQELSFMTQKVFFLD